MYLSFPESVNDDQSLNNGYHFMLSFARLTNEMTKVSIHMIHDAGGL